MNIRVLSVVSMFVVSVIVGRNMFATTEKIQAQPVIPSIIELPSLSRVIKEEKKSVDEINVEVDLSTLEVSVNGTTDAIINVKTTGEPKPVVKWRTRVVEKNNSVGYPYIKSVSKILDNELPSTPLSIVETHE